MERLNKRQIRTLRECHISNPNNRSKFFDCVSTILLTPHLNKEKQDFLREITKTNVCSRGTKVRLVNA